MDDTRGHEQSAGATNRPRQPNELPLVNNIRNIRAILDQARTGFGPETKRMVDELVAKTEGVPNIEQIDLRDSLNPAAWLYLGMVQITETLNAIVVQLSSGSSVGAERTLTDAERLEAGAGVSSR